MEGSRRSFYDILTAAVSDMTTFGFDSPGRVEFWTEELRKAAERSTASPAKMEEMLRAGLGTVYRRLVERGGLAARHRGVSRFLLERVRPSLRAELDRRILASANLIRLNRRQAIEKTLQRFAGWATSVPAGGTEAADRGQVKKDVRKALASLPFEERRVLIDQGHKLTASLSDILARDGQALAGVWHSHWRQGNYDYREDHKDRDLVVYVVRGNWALAKGLMQAPDGYTDEITAPASEINCRCFYQYLYHLRDLPKDMLTKKGADELERVRKIVRGDDEPAYA